VIAFAQPRIECRIGNHQQLVKYLISCWLSHSRESIRRECCTIRPLRMLR